MTACACSEILQSFAKRQPAAKVRFLLSFLFSAQNLYYFQCRVQLWWHILLEIIKVESKMIFVHLYRTAIMERTAMRPPDYQ